MKFKDGDRIKVKPHLWWPNGGVGVVSLPPDFVKEALGGEVGFTSAQRTIAGKERVITSAWVNFDEPAMDYSGDGPYIGGEVSIEHLEPI
ncbi:hypothetical protein [Pseudomonas rubra]|uniref:Uncharacterized protein n=1 Tax=Pseudomonas rubra TaxID=2942627 RepID=A0ABT5PB06_9PSED|nr:hypothetical protein [Pseudomonas rubra]MDD1015493.1 hypothetical protein [Pseudomonas rubra]MDD1041224.1 hypothetical protein [Pseudomonas rubra]MDD1158031.1 hypothetical protein [Pseudomonas rubra]